MDKADIFGQFETILKDVLDTGDIVLTETSSSNNIDGWDSLAHLQLVAAIEKHFKIKFSANEIFLLRNVGEILETIGRKVG